MPFNPFLGKHGFLPHLSRLPNWLVFEEAVVRMMYEGQTFDVTLLIFSKAFDSSVPYDSIIGPSAWAWAQKWDLPINPNKCAGPTVGNLPPLSPSFSKADTDHRIPQVTDARDLGVPST